MKVAAAAKETATFSPVAELNLGNRLVSARNRTFIPMDMKRIMIGA